MSPRLRHALTATFAAAALVAPRAALAEPAVVAVFEAVVRTEPTPGASPVQTLVEGTAVSVSEEATAGWRRVRLADGGAAWIEERALAFPARGASAAPAPSPTATPSSTATSTTPGDLPDPRTPPPPPPAWVVPYAPPDLRARIYVKDLDHLAELVKSDTRAGPMADRLVGRRTMGLVVGGIGLATAAGFLISGMAHMDDHSSPTDPQFGSADRSMRDMTIGALIGSASVLIAGAILPKGSDLLDVVNAWNVGHPDRPFTLDEHHLSR